MMRGYVPFPARVPSRSLGEAGAPVHNRNRKTILVILVGETHLSGWARVTPVRPIVWAGRGLPARPTCAAGRCSGGCIQPPVSNEFCRASVSDAEAFHRNALQLFQHLRRYAIC
jgi:hypothetical protein